MGKANLGMQQAKEKLTEKNTTQAGESQNLAMQGLNEAAVGLFNSIENMKKSGSSSGVEQFMQMMQQMAGQQQGLNQQGLQLALGKMAAAAQAATNATNDERSKRYTEIFRAVNE